MVKVELSNGKVFKTENGMINVLKKDGMRFQLNNITHITYMYINEDYVEHICIANDSNILKFNK